MGEPTTDLERVARDLYGVLPEEFTAARTAAERAARGAGDRALAGRIKALRRPALAAWAVNRLVREQRELVEQVVELGASLRAAQSGLQGEALRELTRQRRQLVSAVTAEARRVAGAHGQRLSDAAARQVEETLQAAMVDPTAGAAVLDGLLDQPLSSTGVESLGASPQEPASPPSVDETSRPALSVVRDDGRARREAEERAAQAQKLLRNAAKKHRSAQKRQEKAQARVLQVEAELDEARRRVAELEQASETAAERLEEQQAALEEASATLADAQHAADAADAALSAEPAAD